ncbi:type IV secretion system protein VirB10 [Nitrosospira sp. Nsp5]|uniref:Type IV secretion system protein VirB10 n=1 Tax=Nitrosospira multiformis TaxID=1231 RepID=A0ABY0TNJ0_9PROT|nr:MULTISPECIES: TrbI/VirB10 family protein [Nitrosospira]PTR05608.1 type IV secretion system protein VirB10 [Nitrosospira sp. Nsp5]SDR11038.1 type IV secretion system protein VirB10 [Nitrosospira multiformis]
MSDPLSPAASPNELPQKWGVRRVNNLPMYLVGAAALVFFLIVMLVAMDRANTRHEEETVKASGNAALYAKEIAGEHQGGMIAPASMPVDDNNLINPDLPPMPPTIGNAPQAPEMAEAQRIRQIKMQQFEEALRAKTTIQTQAQPRAQQSSEMPRPAHASADPTAAYQQRLAQLKRSGLAGYGGAGGYPGDEGAYEGGLNGEQKPRNDISEFSGKGEGDRWKLDSRPIAPKSPYAVQTTFVIPAILISGINSSLPGKIFGQVSQDVYDTATGKYLLIPQGTKLEGEYSSDVAYGQASVLVAWQRLVFPDGKTMDIGAMPGSNSAGYAGFADQVNNHYLRLFGTAILMSAITAGVALSQSQNQVAGTFGAPTTSSVLSATLGQQLGRVMTQMISRNLNISPTLEIRPGYRFNVTVTKDMVFARPYQAFDYKLGG